MHIGRALAKLNPKNVRFDTGFGGIPELTPQDIAAALGAVEDGLGRELLCQVWWPDGAKLAEHHLDAILTDAQRQEWQRREDRMLDAVLIVAMHGGSRGQHSYADAHAERWPAMVRLIHELPIVVEDYAKVRTAVIGEMKDAGLCPICAGRASIRTDAGLACLCPKCLGTGHMATSERSRADACDMTWEKYRSRWAKVYEWTATLCHESTQRATRQFLAQIGC